MGIFLFPEGTDLSESNVEKSHNYSDSKGLKKLHQVLYPKPAGFQMCMEFMQLFQWSGDRCIHDVTIAYKDYVHGTRASEGQLIRGKFPKEVHLIVEGYKIEDVPLQNDEQKQVSLVLVFPLSEINPVVMNVFSG